MTVLVLASAIPARGSTQQAASAGAPQPATGAPLVFDRVTVVDVEQGRLLADQRVVITDNRIRAMGDVGTIPMPKDAQVVDARGKYLIPGLWDMHVHVDDNAGQLYPQFIVHGITGIREMAQRGSFPDSFPIWQREVLAGTRAGPRGIGPSFDLNHVTIATPEEAHRVVDSLKAAGMVFIKYHGSFDANLDNDRDLLFVLLREARRVGIPVVGHVPTALTTVEGADSGMRSIEHVNVDKECWGAVSHGADSIETMAQCAPVAAAYVRNGTWITPTVVVFHDDDPQATGTYLRILYRLGVRRFLAGSDYTMDMVYRPGLSLHQELAFLAEGGLTPLAVLQSATLNPAKFLQATDSFGTVAPGRLADLVLLDGNPLADIANTKAICAVVANGRYFDRAALDGLLAEVQANTKKEP